MSDDLPPDTPWWARILVDNAHRCWRWASVELATLMAIVPMLYEYVPTVDEYLSATQKHYLMTTLAVLTIIARITRQEKPNA